MSEVQKITQDLGRVTAYAFAKSKGYAGSVDDFGQDLANAANYAAESRQSANDAASYAADAEQSAIAAGQSATVATNQATLASESKSNAATSEAVALTAMNNANDYKTAAENAAGAAAAQTMADAMEAVKNLYGELIKATVTDGVLVFDSASPVTVEDGILIIGG